MDESPSDSGQDILQGLSHQTIDDLKQLKMQCSFKNYNFWEFKKVRQLDGISEEAYLAALHPENFLRHLSSQKFSEGGVYQYINRYLGRSGSFFVFSPDKNFILKTVEQSEQQVLRKIAKSFCDVKFFVLS